MRSRTATLAMMLVLSCEVISSLAAAPNPYADGTATSASKYILTPAELRTLTPIALDGDADAALKIEDHYANLPLHSHDAELLFWRTIAAENGNIAGMQHLAIALNVAGGESNCRRSIFWLKKMIATAKLGSQAAESGTSYLEDYQRNLANCAGKRRNRK